MLLIFQAVTMNSSNGGGTTVNVGPTGRIFLNAHGGNGGDGGHGGSGGRGGDGGSGTLNVDNVDNVDNTCVSTSCRVGQVVLTTCFGNLFW